VPASRRGLLESSLVTVSAHPDLARCMRDADPAWLDPAASVALGVPPDLHASAVPIVVAGEPLGLLVFVFEEVEPHDDDNRRLLVAVSAAMGFALLRDRLAQELREAAGTPG
jgi:GAF domain-containing protein